MIDAMKAVSIAEAQGKSFKASRLSVGSSHWFVGVRGELGKPLPGCSPVVIDKETGEVSGICSVPYYVRGDAPTEIESEYESAEAVALPAA